MDSYAGGSRPLALADPRDLILVCVSIELRNLSAYFVCSLSPTPSATRYTPHGLDPANPQNLEESYIIHQEQNLHPFLQPLQAGTAAPLRLSSMFRSDGSS